MNLYKKPMALAIFSLFLSLSVLSQNDQYNVSHDPQAKGNGLTVVDFAASWCKPCLKSLPKLQALSDQNKDVTFLVISVDETQAGRDKLIKRTQVNLPVIWDRDHTWAELYDPKGMPSLFILNEKGDIIYRHVGYNQEKWLHFVEQLKTLKHQ